MSLSLSVLQAELMAVMRVIHFHKTALGQSKSLSGRAVCLNFSHDFDPFFFGGAGARISVAMCRGRIFSFSFAAAAR